ncbi:hypothetical protein K8R04_01770 [Candidatus Uhrbacteria bacterium]|nr:hypothetical protein [Candidatus Uhrbacteria bacterium]
MIDDPIVPQMRLIMRERVIKYEQDLRSDQSYCQPSQIIDRENVPLNLGDYTDEQIDRIIRLEREVAAQAVGLELSSETLLSRALQRYILG